MTLAIAAPLHHRATLVRNVETGTSPTRQPLPASYAVVDADLHVQYWEPERAIDSARAGLREGPNAVLVAVGPRMLVGRRADVQIGDRVTEVRTAGSGEVITAQAMRVVEVLWRQTHQDVGLELISSGPIVEGS